MTIQELAADLDACGGPAEQIDSLRNRHVARPYRGFTEHLPNARITFDKFHVIWRADTAVGKMRRIEQRPDKPLKGMRWSLLTDRSRPKRQAAADAEARDRQGDHHP